MDLSKHKDSTIEDDGIPLTALLRRVVPALERPLVGLLIVVLLALSVRMITYRAPFPPGYDEIVYTRYVKTMAAEGLPGLRPLVIQWSNDEVLNKGPLPLRAFYLFCSMVGCLTLGEVTLANMAIVSMFFGVATIAVAVLLFRRWLGTLLGTFCSLILVCSPLSLLLSRCALQDTCFAFLVTLSFLLLDRVLEHRKVWEIFLLGLVLFAGFMTKESMAFIWPVYLVIIACRREYRRHLRRSALVLLPFVLAPIIALGAMCLLSSGVENLIATYHTYSEMHTTNNYVLQYQRGLWYRYIVDLVLLSPLVVLLAVVGIVVKERWMETIKGRRPCTIYLLCGLAVFSCLPVLNLRVILFLDPCLRMLAALGLLSLASRLPVGTRMQSACALLLFLLVVAIDLVQFVTLDKAGIYDPITMNLVRAAGFAP